MRSQITDEYVSSQLERFGFHDFVAEKGKLMLLELAVKANAGYYSSHTEEGFLGQFDLLRRDRTLNKRGREFVCSMVYASSNRQPECFELMSKYRTPKTPS